MAQLQNGTTVGGDKVLTDSDVPGSATAQFTSTDTGSNINVGSGVFEVPWDTTLIPNAAVAQPTNPEIEVQETGLWEFYASLSFDTGTARINPRIRFRINGTIQNEEGGSGYIRAASGHNEASNSIKVAYNLNAGDIVEVVTDQLGNSGTVTLRSKASVLLVNKIAGKTAALGNADTLDGLDSTAFAKTADLGTQAENDQHIAGSSQNSNNGDITYVV